MGFLKRWFSRKKVNEDDEWEEDQERQVLRRDEIDIRDAAQRERFLKGCLEQGKDAESEIESLSREYSLVTQYLTDMEEIDALPDAEKKNLCAAADKLTVYAKEKEIYEGKPDRMSDTKFRQMERMEDEAKEGIRKLEEAEEYQEKIRQDLSRLSGERHAYAYRRHELRGVQGNMRGMMIICSCAAFACMVILLLLQFMMEMDTQIGYISTAAATAVAIFFIYLKYTDASTQLKQVGKTINKLVLLQNKVKIRYINNTNLLDYLYIKYEVSSAEELQNLWEQYQDEKIEREKYRKVHAEMDMEQRELLRLLRQYRIQNPDIWLKQPEAILNRNEMVEIRHNLIKRRQKLRKQMEYNQELADSAQGEIRTLSEEYPEYASEILTLVSRYAERAR